MSRFAEYASMPGVNWTRLKHMRDSPLAYRHALEAEAPDTDTLALGRITHTLVFEPEHFKADYAVWTGGRRAGKEWDAFCERHAGQTILRDDDLVTAHDMAEAVKRHPDVRPYLAGGEFERIATWTDPRTGLACKARLDWIVPKRRTVVELKTAVSIEARRFGLACHRYGYHCQIAHQVNGCTHGFGWTPERRKFVVVEKAPPHDVAVFDVSEEHLDIGATELAGLLERLKLCTDANHWPGRYEGEQALQLPAFVHGEVEFEYE